MNPHKRPKTEIGGYIFDHADAPTKLMVMFKNARMRLMLLFIVLIISPKLLADEICFDGSSGFNKYVNVTEICVLSNNQAKLKTYNFNNLPPNPPTTCEAEGVYKNTENGFSVTSKIGVCANGNKYEEQNLACKEITKDVLECNEEKYNAKFII